MTHSIHLRLGIAVAVLLLAGVSPGRADGGSGRSWVADTTPAANALISWGDNAINYRGQVGRRIAFSCPPGGSLGTVWGTDVYTDDSSICTAAVHAGVISRDAGGSITIEMRPGQGTYAASTRQGVTTRSYGSWYGSFAIVGGLLRNPTIGWGANAVLYRGRVGQRFSFTCPSGGAAGTVWGTDLYTDDSSICTAAAHVGIITLATGGPVTIEIRPGQTSYAATTRNGVTSRSYGSWQGSFLIVGGGGPPPPPNSIRWEDNAVQYRGQNGTRLTFACHAGGTLKTVWGTDVYTDDSSICTAAVHAGAITAAGGGSVTIEIRPGLATYPASTRNGVATSRWGAWTGSFVIVGATRGSADQSWSGAISSSDRVRDDGSWYDAYTVNLNQGDRVVIALTSSDFDAYLTVVSPTGAQTSDDDSGGGTNSRLTLTADRSGTWTIWANTFRTGETGSYTLTVDRQ